MPCLGYEEIVNVVNACQQAFGNEVQAMPLHSSCSSKEQQAVFNRPVQVEATPAALCYHVPRYTQGLADTRHTTLVTLMPCHALSQGITKIVCSTNIAETAVTIEDVVYVIDSGRVKEKVSLD